MNKIEKIVIAVVLIIGIPACIWSWYSAHVSFKLYQTSQAWSNCVFNSGRTTEEGFKDCKDELQEYNKYRERYVEPFTQEALETYPAEKVPCEFVEDNETGWHVKTPCKIPAEKKPAEFDDKICWDNGMTVFTSKSGAKECISLPQSPKPKYPLESENFTLTRIGGENPTNKFFDYRLMRKDSVGGYGYFYFRESEVKELYQLLKQKYE